MEYKLSRLGISKWQERKEDIHSQTDAPSPTYQNETEWIPAKTLTEPVFKYN